MIDRVYCPAVPVYCCYLVPENEKMAGTLPLCVCYFYMNMYRIRGMIRFGKATSAAVIQWTCTL